MPRRTHAPAASRKLLKVTDLEELKRYLDNGYRIRMTEHANRRDRNPLPSAWLLERR